MNSLENLKAHVKFETRVIHIAMVTGLSLEHIRNSAYHIATTVEASPLQVVEVWYKVVGVEGYTPRPRPLK